MGTKLPNWMTVAGDGVVIVDPDLAYPLVLAALGVEEKDADQYDLETVYQTVKMTVQSIYFGSEHDKGKALDIRIKDGGPRWALKRRKPGRGIAAATKGREAKAQFGKVARALTAA